MKRIICSTHNGASVDCSLAEHESLAEMATICAMCNDSAVDYNESKRAYEKVGEATETALVVLVEKLNVYGNNRTALSPRQLGSAANRVIHSMWNKVRICCERGR